MHGGGRHLCSERAESLDQAVNDSTSFSWHLMGHTIGPHWKPDMVESARQPLSSRRSADKEIAD